MSLPSPPRSKRTGRGGSPHSRCHCACVTPRVEEGEERFVGVIFLYFLYDSEESLGLTLKFTRFHPFSVSPYPGVVLGEGLLLTQSLGLSRAAPRVSSAPPPRLHRAEGCLPRRDGGRDRGSTTEPKDPSPPPKIEEFRVLPSSFFSGHRTTYGLLVKVSLVTKCTPPVRP